MSNTAETAEQSRATAVIADTDAGEPVAPGVAGHDQRQIVLRAVAAWQSRLSLTGVACRAVAVDAADPSLQLAFSDPPSELASHWQRSRETVLVGLEAVSVRLNDHPAADLLLAAPLQLPDGLPGVIGLWLAPPHGDRTVQTTLMALGWLQLQLSAARIERSQRAAKLLALLGHVASQAGPRAAAQEWINRTAAWAREVLAPTQISTSEPGQAPSSMHDAADALLALTLFEVRSGLPRWWVSSDTAWVEQASPAMQDARELATRAMVEMAEAGSAQNWALPSISDGEVVAVLVLDLGRLASGSAIPALTVCRASLSLAEPLLRHWQQSEQPLWRHHLASAGWVWGKLRGPGNLSWKASAAGLVLLLLALLVWPVPDRVNANAVIEGQMRMVVTAPFDGFIGKVAVRPGQHVIRSQVMAQLDDRDLRLEQSKTRSERDQAAAKLRQAMSERDAPAMALAQAEVQQAEAQLALVEAKLSRAELLAPIDGLLVSGDWVQQIGGPVEIGKEMFEIAAGDAYRVVLHVPDRDIARLHVGQPGQMRLTGQPQVTHGFTIDNITATASVQDGVNGFRVEARWQGPAPALSPGMQGVGKVEVGHSNLLTIWTRSSLDWLRLKVWAWSW